MSDDAIARLRDAARGTRGQTLLLGDVIVNANDLRALLDAHAELEKEIFTVDDVLRAANTLAEERAEKAEAERDALRAQVEAARAVANRVESARGSMFAARDVAGDVLAAMDGAKPSQGG